jgi:hypothetical protein
VLLVLVMKSFSAVGAISTIVGSVDSRRGFALGLLVRLPTVSAG